MHKLLLSLKCRGKSGIAYILGKNIGYHKTSCEEIPKMFSFTGDNRLLRTANLNYSLFAKSNKKIKKNIKLNRGFWIIVFID